MQGVITSVTEPDLDRLLAAAARRDRPADDVWPAAAAAIELLWWHDRFAEAVELTLTTLRDLQHKSGTLHDQDLPFDAALLAGVHAGRDPLELVEGARTIVPAESVLGKRLAWLASNLPVRGVPALLGDAPGAEAQPFRRPERALADRDPAELSDAERTRLWNACCSRNQYPTAKRLLDATGEPPSRWPAAVWMAGRLAQEGDRDRAVSVLIQSLPWWIPYEPWDVVPTELVLRLHLRDLVTPELRAAVLASADISKVPGIGQ